MIRQRPSERMTKIVKQIKHDPFALEHEWGEGHEWDSAIIYTTVERIEDRLHSVMEMPDKLGLAAYILTLRQQDVWDAAESYIESRDTANTKNDIEMSPSALCPSMFEEWYR